MKKKGFTLIELLVVVAIISLVTSIVLASLKSARDRATVSKFIQEAQSLKKGLELFRVSTGAYPVPSNGSYARSAASTTEMVTLVSGLSPYVKINTMDVVSLQTAATNFHYIGGAWAVTNNAYKTCGGVTIRSDQYLIMFTYPPAASYFATENTPGGTTTGGGYQCFIAD